MKNFAIQKDMPKEGQFVAIWVHNDCPWSLGLRWEDGNLHEYGCDLDRWRLSEFLGQQHLIEKAVYIVVRNDEI